MNRRRFGAPHSNADCSGQLSHNEFYDTQVTEEWRRLSLGEPATWIALLLSSHSPKTAQPLAKHLPSEGRLTAMCCVAQSNNQTREPTLMELKQFDRELQIESSCSTTALITRWRSLTLLRATGCPDLR